MRAHTGLFRYYIYNTNSWKSFVQAIAVALSHSFSYSFIHPKRDDNNKNTHKTKQTPTQNNDEYFKKGTISEKEF